MKMSILRTQQQKDNLAKFFWDMAKVAFTFFVLAPLAQTPPSGSIRIVAGLAIGFTLVSIGYILDGQQTSEDAQ